MKECDLVVVSIISVAGDCNPNCQAVGGEAVDMLE